MSVRLGRAISTVYAMSDERFDGLGEVSRNRASSDAARGLPRRGVRVLMVAALVVAVAGVGWRGVATSRLGHVVVAWDNASGHEGPISCRGTTVTERRLGDPVRRVPVLRLQPGMDCALSIRLVNRGSGTVHLGTVVLPYMGPEGGAEVQVANLADLPRAAAQSEDGLHAAFTLDRALTEGESYGFTIHFTHRDDGCSDATTWIGNFPRLSVSTLAVTDTVASPRTLAFQGTGRASGCRDHN